MPSISLAVEGREYHCAMAGKLAHRHGYGRPIHRDALIRYASIPRDREGEARDAFESFRKLPFIEDLGGEMVRVNNSEFGSMIEFLHTSCGWPESDLRTRFHHFEGWDKLDFE